MNSTIGALDNYEELLNSEENDGAFFEYYRLTSFIKYSDIYDLPQYEVLLSVTIIHLCICAVGYAGNILTCIAIASDKSMRTTSNIYLFNLAVADLLMLSTGLINDLKVNWYPFKYHRMYGIRGCFIVAWLSHTAVNVASMTITAFTIDRYLAICCPVLARMILSISSTIKQILVIWIIGTFFGYLIGSQQRLEFLLNESMCVNDHIIPLIVEVESLIFFFSPFVLMTVLYILIWNELVDSSKIQKNQVASSRQVLKILVTVAAVFCICWAPYNFKKLLGIHVKEWLPNTFIGYYTPDEFITSSIYYIIYFLSSAVNPIIYSIMSHKFRDAFKKVFRCWDTCREKQLTTTKHNKKSTETAV